MVFLNELIGTFGKYHWWLCFLIFLNKFGVAFHQMAIIFLAPPVRYRCVNENATCCDNPLYDTTLFTRTIITEWNLICKHSWLKDFNQTLFQFGVLSGSMLLGIASDRYGRRLTLVISVIVEVFTGVMTSFLPDYWSFTIIRMTLGISVGGIMVIGFVILMEYVGSTKRDLIAALFHIPFTIGHMLLSLFAYYIRDYTNFQLAISVANVILLFYICLLPESPRWLLAVNKTKEAINLMEHVARINNLPTEAIQETVELYQMQHKSRRDKKGTFVDLFRTPNLRKNILVMSFIWFVCSYCFYGVSQYISYLTGNIFINVVASGCVCLCACIIAIPLMKVMGRKTVTIFANVSCGICLLIISIIPEGIASVIFGCIGVLFSFMVLVVVYLYCSEMFPTVVRNAALGISSMMARVGAMIAPFVAALRPHGHWCAPVAFGIFPLIAALLCILLPETKDCELMVTIEEGEAFGKKPRIQMENTSLNGLMPVGARGTMAAGLLLCTAWYYTILAGFYLLYCPVMYLMFFNHKLYRKIADALFALWELYPVALFQWCCNTHLHHFGDYVDPDEKTIIVVNHRTRVDWNYIWIALYHATQKSKSQQSCNTDSVMNDVFHNYAGGKSKIKFVLKDEIKVIPGMGWIMQLNFFLYVKRNWREDQLNLSQFVDYYRRLRYDYRLVLFPEGTDLSDENRRRSEKFAIINNLQRYEFVLHPRTTGWAVLCSRLHSSLTSVYDVTIAYDKPAQTETDLLRGKIPQHAYFYFKRYAIEQLPREEDALRIWLNDRWREKETSLNKFHSDGNFIDPTSDKAPIERMPRSLQTAKKGFIFWTLVDIIFTYALLYSIIFQFWFIYHSLLFVFVTWYFGGFHNIQYKLSEKFIL